MNEILNKASDAPQVLIVGAGPVGMATAIELAGRGIRCKVVERQVRAGYAPRAKTTHTRTREHLRRWGIADDLAAAAPFGVDYPSNIVFVTRLSGPQIAKFENGLNCAPERDERYSEHSQWIPQYKLEAVLQHHAATFPEVSIEYGREFVDFDQDDNSVTVRIRNVTTGEIEEITVDYLVGADGSGSVVREKIGAKMIGTYGLSRNYNTIFRAPGLAEAHDHGPGVMYWQINEDVPSLIGPMDEGDLWFFMPTYVGKDQKYTKEETLDLIKRSTGIDLPYEILSSDDWVASKLLADRYSLGRVYLAGDACHLHPPFGGFGMNMGVADGVDLGWKMAAVLNGWGGEHLLDSYEAERRVAHEFVLDEAESNHSLVPNQLLQPAIEDDSPAGEKARADAAALIHEHKRNEFYALGVVLGYCYQGSPIVVDDGSMASWKRSRDYVPSAIPGCLAPHAWMDDGQSLYDLFGPDFTLLVFGEGKDADIATARAAADAAGVPLKVVELGADFAKLYGATAALIRPDQHVAWRGDSAPDEAVFAAVTGG